MPPPAVGVMGVTLYSRPAGCAPSSAFALNIAASSASAALSDSRARTTASTLLLAAISLVIVAITASFLGSKTAPEVMDCERTGIADPSRTHAPAAAALTTRPGTVKCATPVMSTRVPRAISSAPADSVVKAATRSETDT